MKKGQGLCKWIMFIGNKFYFFIILSKIVIWIMNEKKMVKQQAFGQDRFWKFLAGKWMTMDIGRSHNIYILYGTGFNGCETFRISSTFQTAISTRDVFRSTSC